MNQFEALTPRGRLILAQLCAGRTHKEVADAIGISIKTVDNHLCRHRRKWRARTTVELVAKVLASGELRGAV